MTAVNPRPDPEELAALADELFTEPDSIIEWRRRQRSRNLHPSNQEPDGADLLDEFTAYWENVEAEQRIERDTTTA